MLMNRAENASRQTGIPTQVIFNAIMEYRNRATHANTEQALPPQLEVTATKLKTFFPYTIMYFPTYRRVEEDLQNLGYIEKDLGNDERLIQFGMEDVSTRFKRITSEIRNSSFEWYSKISGNMIDKFIDGLDSASIDYKSIEKPEAVAIVLDRVGISLERKKHTLELIESREIKNALYDPLAYFLSNLLQVYEGQKNNDNAIKNFARVCNSYLDEKEVRYDESKVDIQIISTRSGREVLLNRLSSGEKQVISIFSRLFLDKSSAYAVLFDEPELSLSMEWQKRLLQDIVDSSHCRFLLAATHSPFIFDNSLDKFASTLDIKYKKVRRESRYKITPSQK
jgi:predicted ATP-binding protein involved in virulence